MKECAWFSSKVLVWEEIKKIEILKSWWYGHQIWSKWVSHRIQNMKNTIFFSSKTAKYGDTIKAVLLAQWSFLCWWWLTQHGPIWWPNSRWSLPLFTSEPLLPRKEAIGHVCKTPMSQRTSKIVPSLTAFLHNRNFYMLYYECGVQTPIS